MRISKLRVLDRVLRTLDRLRDHLRLERHVVGERLAHHPVHRAGREEPHEVVFERQVEAALAGVTLAAGTTTELVVDAAALVPLGAEHVEPAELADLVALGPALGLEPLEQLVELLGGLLGRAAARRAAPCGRDSSGLPPRRMSTPRPAMFVATVTAPGRPAWVTMCASRSCCLALSTWCGMPRRSRRRESSSDFSTEIVPTSTGWPTSWRSSMSSAAASNLAASLL